MISIQRLLHEGMKVHAQFRVQAMEEFSTTEET